MRIAFPCGARGRRKTGPQTGIGFRMENARLFSRWYDIIAGGKYVVVVVVADEDAKRTWVVTAYIARRTAGGETEWKKS